MIQRTELDFARKRRDRYGIEIQKIGAARPVPFFRSPRLQFSVEWRSLWRGSIVSEAVFLGPEHLGKIINSIDAQLYGLF